ncbi:methyl-accepting chemotaxis protein [Anaerosolibacter carboniphilus]|uniref:Methyl-accepting chemotaxis protein n=1 Tax=Anaerosolibacter carboniphilus TaxID=1417629 RepID=A0A841KVL9_9FIRM|nr:methyl-accepting chemotaxis protein [Anaerosolibacter carboniphilus]MBB6214239.1 methyl-accepting chemotaxis protein [Anaerosolibacter carboniphilus]
MRFLQRFSSIHFKMMAIFLPIVLVATVSITTMSFLDTKKEVTHLIEKQVENGLNELVEKMEHEFTAHKRIAEAVSSFYMAKGNTLNKEDYRTIIEKILPLNKNTLGSGIWLEPYTYSEETQYFGPYIYKDGDQLVYTEDYESPDYSYPNTDWYQIGKNTKNGVGWTDPYYDEASGITMITAAVPFYVDEKFSGIVSADYDLTTIQKIILDVIFEKSGYAFLLDSKGQFIAHKDQEKVMKQKITEDAELKALGEDLIKNDRGSTMVTVGGVEFEAYYITLPSTGWKLVTMAPVDELYSALQTLVYKSIFVTGIIILLSALFIYIFSSQLAKGIRQFVDKIEFLAKGDFTQSVTIKSNDEIGRMGRYYNEVLEKLRSMITTIYSSAESVAATAEELAASTEETSKSITEVANSIQMVATNSYEQSNHVEKMSQSTRDIHDQMRTISLNIEEAKNSTIYSSDLAKEGNKYVNDVIHQIKEINAQVTESASTIYQLNEKSRKIEEIISIITSIAEQTNLLALNAAIEAARAGEHGKGFAVVADEVRKLAEASSKSSGDISLLIGEIQQGISQSVEVMNASTRSTQSGIEVVEQTGQAFKNITASIEDVTIGIEDVYGSVMDILKEVKQMKEMVEALNEIAVSNDESTQSVSAATQQQTAIIEQVRGATEELANMSSELQSEISKFKI